MQALVEFELGTSDIRPPVTNEARTLQKLPTQRHDFLETIYVIPIIQMA